MKRLRVDEGIPTLALALAEHMNADELKVLASLTKSPTPTRKADLVEHILHHLEGDRLQTLWQSLDEIQKAAVAEVVHSHGAGFPAQRFHAKYGRFPDFGNVRKYARDGRPTPLRFFFFGGGERGGGVMPDDLKERLGAFVPHPIGAQVKSLEQLPVVHDRPFVRWDPVAKTNARGTEPVPLVVRETERSAERELLSVLRLVDAGKVSVSDKTRRPSASAVDSIGAVLDGGDFYPPQSSEDSGHDENAGPIRAFAWPLLVQAGGLAQLSGSKLQLTKAGRKALAEPAAQTLKDLWEKWCSTTILDELSRIECVKGQTGKGQRGLTSVSSRRGVLALALGECPSQRWISADELGRLVEASGEGFCVTRNPWDLYICDPQYGSFGYEGSSRHLEGRYLLCLLFEYAATLGLIDVAYIPPAGARPDYHELWGTDDMAFFSRYDGLLYFRINGLGAYCVGSAESYAPAPMEVKPALRVLPNLEVVAIGAELEHGDRLALDCYAERTSDVVWKLEAAKLLLATEEGRTIAEIREFLSARSGAPLPEAVMRLLDDVADRSARIHDHGLARLLECAEPALAALIANDSRTRRHCMRAGERHLAVPAASEAAFRRGLRELGYLVAHGHGHARAAARPAATDVAGRPAAEA